MSISRRLTSITRRLKFRAGVSPDLETQTPVQSYRPQIVRQVRHSTSPQDVSIFDFASTGVPERDRRAYPSLVEIRRELGLELDCSLGERMGQFRFHSTQFSALDCSSGVAMTFIH